MRDTVLVTGCHGLLGQKLLEILGNDFGEIHGFDLHPENWFQGLANYHYHQVDLKDRDDILRRVEQIKPGIIINAAAMTNVDACELERDLCWTVNVNAVKTLAEAAGEWDSRLIQISSDYVFDGEAGPYSELDRPNPVSHYGASKLAAEQIALQPGLGSTVLRTMVLYGHGRRLKPSFVAWLVMRLREKTPIKIVTDQIGNTTLVDDLALAIRKSLELNKTGLFHAAGRGILSRYEFAQQIAELYNLSTENMKPTLTKLLGQTAPRPLQSGLIVDNTEAALKMNFKDVLQALHAYREQEAAFN